ncbi:MAG: biotin-dependent carboxyltransferase family protein [Synergistaceae bacterium]|jgi:biotin-dependent carboxylase-like uncharacterized protein|nr:biotin-dependent carboxyltransferase family protein [Synergistaceae bacterium]
MCLTEFEVLKPGMFTTVQDLGRHGYQMWGIPVAGAMDGAALRLGNILVGNEENTAGLEITMTGPVLKVLRGEGCFAVTGAKIGVTKNGFPLPYWTTHRFVTGDVLALGMVSSGFRAYLCVGGGFDVPLVMGSRSTYTRGGFGGYQGRALRASDLLLTGTADVLWAECEGLECPPVLRPNRDPGIPLRAITAQEDAFAEEGLVTFYSSEYVISNVSDRMGYRMEGPTIAHRETADIISDVTCLGSVQVPGHGQPIVMLADRQTTGGYAKIATVCAVDVENLAQRLPGQKVHFARVSVSEAVELLRKEETLFSAMKKLRAAKRSISSVSSSSVSRGTWNVTVNGENHQIEWERLG